MGKKREERGIKETVTVSLEFINAGIFLLLSFLFRSPVAKQIYWTVFSLLESLCMNLNLICTVHLDEESSIAFTTDRIRK